MAKQNNRRNKFKGQSKYNSRKDDKRPNSKEDFKGSKDEELKSTTNDPAWYSEDAALLRDAASIPFVWRTGSYFDDGVVSKLKTDSTHIVDEWEGQIPGICAIEIYPSIGLTDSPKSPINIAATAMYSFVRHANSGHKNYDATDLMMYCIAMSSIYSCLNWLQRLYGISMVYSQQNMYLPDQLIRANGVDPSSIQNNLADFRYRLNVLINKAASLAVPATLPLFKRQAFLFQNVYCEGASVKDQMYLYIPAAFYKREMTSQGCKLALYKTPLLRNWKGSAPTFSTYDAVLNYASELIEAVYADEDCGVMSGDILKAYGLENIIKLQPVDPDYTISPIVDLAVLEQMKNATCYEEVTGDIEEEVPDLSYNSPYLTCHPRFSDTSLQVAPASTFNLKNVYRGNRILTTSALNPTPAIVIENTRLLTYTDNNDWIISGTEIAGRCWIWVGPTYDTEFRNIVFVDYVNATLGSSAQTCNAEQFTSVASFKYRPQQVIFEYSKNGSTYYMTHMGYNIDFDNYVVLSHDELQRLHETAILSELHVPLIGKAQ